MKKLQKTSVHNANAHFEDLTGNMKGTKITFDTFFKFYKSTYI